MTPHTVHHGHAVELTQRRVVTLTAAFAANPNRFKQVAPTPPALPSAAWINPPKQNLASTKRTEIGMRERCSGYLWLLQQDPWIPATPGQKRLGILYLDDIAQGDLLVWGVLIV
jgi:hypothetical protein